MTSAIPTMAGSEAAEATADVLGIKSLVLARGVVAGKNDKTAVLPATMHGYLGKGYRKTCHSSMTSAITTIRPNNNGWFLSC